MNDLIQSNEPKQINTCRTKCYCGSITTMTLDQEIRWTYSTAPVPTQASTVYAMHARSVRQSVV